MDDSGYTDAGEFFQPGKKPLPVPMPTTPSGPAGGAPGAFPGADSAGGDPITKFNMGLYQLLQRAQSGNSAPLYARAGDLQNKQIEDSMRPASELGTAGLAPGDAMAARRSASERYDPEVRAINDRIRLQNESINQFESAIKAAKEYGEEYAKYVKPSEATIEAVKAQMRQGFLPSDSVLQKVQGSLTEDDWKALARAKAASTEKKPKTEAEMVADYIDDYKDAGILPTDSLQTAQEKLKGSKLYQDRVRGPQGPQTTQTERNQSKQSQVISSAINLLDRERASSSDGKASPDTYRTYKTAYINAGGTSADWFQAVPVEVYISKSNQAGDLAQKSSDDSSAAIPSWLKK